MATRRTLIGIALVATFLISCGDKKIDGIAMKDVKKLFSSGVYFLAFDSVIKDRASLDRAVDDLLANEEAVTITSTKIDTVGDFDPEKNSVSARMDVQSETAAGIAVATFTPTLERRTDESGAEYYRLYLFNNGSGKGLTIYKSMIPAYLEKADSIIRHFSGKHHFFG